MDRVEEVPLKALGFGREPSYHGLREVTNAKTVAGPIGPVSGMPAARTLQQPRIRNPAQRRIRQSRRATKVRTAIGRGIVCYLSA